MLRQHLGEPMASSPLMRQGGFAVFDGVLAASSSSLMLEEATSLMPGAQPIEVSISDRQDWRGGSPVRRFLNAPGGPVQDAFYGSWSVLEFLGDVAGARVQPSGTRGSYTYYARPGDHLGLHRDIEICDLAVSICLHDGPDLAGGTLCLYPDRLFEPLSSIRSSPTQGAIGVQLRPGQALVLFGGIVPHCVLPVAERQVRIVSLLCYRVG